MIGRSNIVGRYDTALSHKHNSSNNKKNFQQTRHYTHSAEHADCEALVFLACLDLLLIPTVRLSLPQSHVGASSTAERHCYDVPFAHTEHCDDR